MRPTLIGPLLSCESAEAAIIRAASAAARERAGKGCIERAPGNRGKAGRMSRRGQAPAAGTLKTAKSLLRRVAPQGGFRQCTVCGGGGADGSWQVPSRGDSFSTPVNRDLIDGGFLRSHI